MRTLKTSEAAALLNVSPNTLRAWDCYGDLARAVSLMEDVDVLREAQA